MSERAKYGAALFENLSASLRRNKGIKYHPRELRRCRQFDQTGAGKNHIGALRIETDDAFALCDGNIFEPTPLACDFLEGKHAAVDFAVPFSPRINTPPMRGLIAFNTSARFSRSWPTRALNG